MIEQELMHGELFVIRHKATHKLLQGFPDGRSHTRLALDNPSKVRTIPRLFDSEKGAKIIGPKYFAMYIIHSLSLLTSILGPLLFHDAHLQFDES